MNNINHEKMNITDSRSRIYAAVKLEKIIQVGISEWGRWGGRKYGVYLGENV